MDRPLDYLQSEDHVPVLSALEAVRTRPGMYIGDTDIKGFHHLASEVIDNAVEEAVAGYCSEIEVVLNPHDRLTVKDNGRGISVSAQSNQHKPYLETVLTTLRPHKKEGDEVRHEVCGGLHGVGLFTVNALSEEMIVETHRDGGCYRICCSQGLPMTPLERVGDCEDHGTIITFTPDRTIFPAELHFDDHWFRNDLRERAYLNPNVRITWNNTVTQRRHVYHYDKGILQWVCDLNRRRTPIHLPVYASGSSDGVRAEIAFQYHVGRASTIKPFANNVQTTDVSDQTTGFYSGLIAAFTDHATAQGEVPEAWKAITKAEIAGALSHFWYDDEHTGSLGKRKSRQLVRAFSCGLTAVISVWTPRFEFRSAVKNNLYSPEANDLVHRLTDNAVQQFCSQYPEIAQQLIARFRG